MSRDATPLLSAEFVARLERLELVSRKMFRGQLKGERRSPRKGQSVEFADYRPYVAGDDTRFLDWNGYARLDRLFLKLFLEEEDLHVYLLVDTSRSMGFGEPTKLEFARQLAAALAYVALVRSDRVKVETLSQSARQVSPPLRGRGHVWQLFRQLSQLEAEGETDLAVGVRNFRLRNPGRGLVVLVSDLLDKQGCEAALRLLAAQECDVFVVHVLADEELEPQLAGDLRLVDCEDAEETEITVSVPLLARYRAMLEQFVGGARDFCHRRGMGYLMLSNRTPVEAAVTQYLRRRGLVR